MPNITKAIYSISIIATFTAAAQAQDETIAIQGLDQPTGLAERASAWSAMMRINLDVAEGNKKSFMERLILMIATPAQVADFVAGVDPEEIILSSGWSLGDVLDFKISDNLFQIRPRHSRKCLDVAGSSTANSAQIVQNECISGRDSQMWRLIRTSFTAFTFISQNSGKCLDVRDSSIANSADIIQFSCHFRENQQWESDDPYLPPPRLLVAKHSGKCLDIRRSSTANGADVIQFTCHGRDNQRFTWGP